MRYGVKEHVVFFYGNMSDLMKSMVVPIDEW